ncbi:hypothetical protein JHK82_033702 [Glycine max]|nr:hypothetical protein JHK86_033782 [Glycine max]KAG5119282.1 hypothetical protein JHK82_033702 [Glycine max]
MKPLHLPPELIVHQRLEFYRLQKFTNNSIKFPLPYSDSKLLQSRMGGHRGLNVLPKKRWSDKRFVATMEQLKREETRKREAELCLDRLRVAQGLALSISIFFPS